VIRIFQWLFQLSGELSMIHAAAKAGVFNLKDFALKSSIAIFRAGTGSVIGSFIPEFLHWL
jgi:porphobilinogen synthase